MTARQRFVVVLFGPEPERDSILLRDCTWITFARLLRCAVRPVPVWEFATKDAAARLLAAWPGVRDEAGVLRVEARWKGVEQP